MNNNEVHFHQFQQRVYWPTTNNTDTMDENDMNVENTMDTRDMDMNDMGYYSL